MWDLTHRLGKCPEYGANMGPHQRSRHFPRPCYSPPMTRHMHHRRITLVDGSCQETARARQARHTEVVSPALAQLIASDDVAATLATVAVSRPVNGIVEVAGPGRVSLAELVKRFLIKTGDSRQVLADSNARYFGAVLNDQSLTPGANPRIGSTTFEEWLSTSKPKT